MRGIAWVPTKIDMVGAPPHNRSGAELLPPWYVEPNIMKNTASSLALPCALRAALAVVLGGVAGCATHPPVTAQGLALKRVVIYRNGVGYFERAGHVDSSRVEFKVRKNEVGDFLASLAVLERGGSSVRSASFPVEVEGEGGGEDDRPQPPRPPEPRPIPPGGTLVPPASGTATSSGLKTVTMSLDGKSHDLQVGYIAATPVWRPSYRLVVDKQGATLQAWGIVHNQSGEDWNNVSLSLIAEAPLAFQASLQTPVVPERPTVTDGGDVIAVVPRSETSLGQDAPPPPPPSPSSSSVMAPPPPAEDTAMDEVESPAEGATASRAARKDKSAQVREEKAAARGAASGRAVGNVGQRPPRPPLPAYSRQAKNLSALAAIGLQAGATRYEIPFPVSIPNESATMVLLLDRRIPGEAVSLYAPDDGVPESASHPFRVARFTNKTGGLLERGPLAIFEEGAFLGQGMTDPLPEGAVATVPFALERTLAVEKSREHKEEGARLYRIEAGSLTVGRDVVTLTKYRLRNGAQRMAKLLLKHPRSPGARLHHPPKGTEDNVGSGSALIPTEVGTRATLELEVDERQQTTRGLDWMSPLADDAVQAYLADRRADPATAGQLRAAWEIRKVLVRSVEQRSKLGAEEADRRRATEETRRNLRALEKNKAAGALRAKLTARLGDDSARLDEVSKRLVEVDLAINEQQVRFKDAIRAIKLLAPLPPQ
jgi:hypothetical protein